MSDVYLSQSRTPLPHLRCPKCGGPCDGWSGLSMEEFAQPEPGSRTLCGTCGAFLVFIESAASYRALALRMATAAEIAAICAHKDPKVRQLWTLAQEFVAKRNQRQRTGQG
ncbi:MAG TPA: hypothetical protein VE030_11180 [Burkholderiales bacterium]|nr:hypothetical protein [Burkholderiales bacterium]